MFAEVDGEGFYLGWELRIAAHVVGAESGLIQSGDDPAAARGADTGSSKGVGVADAAFGQSVDVGCDGVRVAVAADGGADVFAGKPEDVGTVLGVRGEEEEQGKERNELHLEAE